MALVDWHGVVLDLRAYLVGKDGNSFGQRELVQLLTELEVKHAQVEGLPERALRLYGEQLQEALNQGGLSNTPSLEGPGDMTREPTSSSGHITPEGGSNGRSPSPGGSRAGAGRH